MPLNPEFKKRWIEALRSGNYPQTEQSLKDQTGYCCLGVACDVLNPDGWTQVGSFGRSKWVDRSGEYIANPSQMLPTEMIGLDTIQQCKLVMLNDQKIDFNFIADYINTNF